MQKEMKRKYDKPVVNVIHANCGGFMEGAISNVTINGSGNNTSTDEVGTASGDDINGTIYSSKGHTILWDEEEE